MPHEPPLLNEELLEQARQNDGELPSDYLAQVKLPLRLRIPSQPSVFCGELVGIFGAFLFIGIFSASCIGLGLLMKSAFPEKDVTNSPIDFGTGIAQKPTPTVIILYDETTPHPTSVPCEITSLSSRPAPIYSATDRTDIMGYFAESETLQIVGDANQKWYAVSLEDGSIGWFYFQDTWYQAEFCNK